MAKINDAIDAAIVSLSPQDSVPDKLLRFYQAGGATSGKLQDAERQYLLARGATSSSNQDMWFQYLRNTLGYTGALPEMMLRFWTEQVVKSLATQPVLWGRYGQGIVQAGGFASQWSDYSGNARHLLAGAANTQPAVDSDGTLNFDGVDDFLKVLFALNQPCTWYTVVRRNVQVANRRITSGAAAGTYLFMSGAVDQVAISAGATLQAPGEPPIGAWTTAGYVFNGVTSSLQFGGNAAAVGDAGIANPGGVTLGAQTNGALNWSNVSFREIVVFDIAHDAATRARMMQFLGLVN